MTEAVATISPHRSSEAATAQRQEITAKFFHGLSDLTRMRIVELLLDEASRT